MKIKPSSYIRNDYAELSSYCRESGEPVYITRNGEGDLVVMSMDSYEQMQDRMKRLEERIAFYQSRPELFDKKEPLQEKRKTKDGKTINVIHTDDQSDYISRSDAEMDERAVEAVKAALLKSYIRNKPIAKYDTDSGQAYVEYPDGRKVNVR